MESDLSFVKFREATKDLTIGDDVQFGEQLGRTSRQH